MLRMPEFEVHLPRTASEAASLRRSLPDSMYVAGGTDLLPNLKHWLHTPKHLVSLSAVDELVGIELLGDGTLRIGAGTSLHAVATSEVVRREVPGLASAAGAVAGPQHRRMGTLGGNVMLDTRCLFYNQSEEWRRSLTYCLKKDGDWCHVIGSSKRCVAAHSADTVPVLLAVGASIETDEATLPLDDLYVMDGRYEQNRSLDPAALVRAIVIPPRPSGHRSVYRKVRSRGAVDFPQLGVGIAGSFDGDVVTGLVGVLSAVLPKPKAIKGFEAAVGTRLDDRVIDDLAELAFKQTHPQTSLHGDPAWRRHMVRVEVRRALRDLRQ